MHYIKEFFKYTFDFVGVTTRRDYWITMSMVFMVHLVLTLLSFVLNFFLIIESVFTLVVLVPSLAIMARRLHDTDRSAFNLFWLLFPFVGLVVLIVYTLEKTKYFVE